MSKYKLEKVGGITYHCPLEIMELFITEELAAKKGRLTLIKWIKSLKLKQGDKVILPIEADGVLHTFIKGKNI